MSLNIVSPVVISRYSLEARRLDQIAENNDVIIVISAGNLDKGKQRPEWPVDETKAALVLASHRDDQLFIPAESVRNISVSAINPPGLSTSIDGALARYSRRGPGLRSGVKPDLCHVGGSGTTCTHHEHGLFSLADDGKVISGCGTSYAAPLVAKTLWV
jgi:subtilisin family serine protease